MIIQMIILLLLFLIKALIMLQDSIQLIKIFGLIVIHHAKVDISYLLQKLEVIRIQEHKSVLLYITLINHIFLKDIQLEIQIN